MDLFFNQSLHLLIRLGDLKPVESFLENNPSDDRYHLNDKSESAIKTAIVYKQLDIYDLLKSKRMCLGQHERMDVVTSGLSDSEKKKLSSINKKYFTNANIKPKHLEILISRTKLGHDEDVENKKKFKESYCAAFEDLNEIPLIENILKVASTAEPLCIVFDFHRKSVEHMNPAKNESVRGLTCLADNYIYIGALNLQDPQTRWMVLGTIAHELCHLALKIVYNNSCKPYVRGDTEREKEFELIVELCEKCKDQENLIELVFQYDSNKWHAELIVRVPHILVQYWENTYELSQARQNFSVLFNFFEKYTLKALISEYSKFETRVCIKDANRELNFAAEFLRSSYVDISFLPGVLSLNLDANGKIIQLSTKFSRLVIKAIREQIRGENKLESSYIFANLKYLEDPLKYNLIEAVIELVPRPAIILDCSEIAALKELIPLALKFRERVILVTNDNFKIEAGPISIEKREINLGWEDLSDKCKDKLLKQRGNFQGQSVTLDQIIHKSHLDSFEAELLKKLIEESDLEIGTGIIACPNYIERKLLGIDPREYSDDLTFEYDVGDMNIFEFLEQQRIILLCDEPGMGKSTELKMLAFKLKVKFPNRWIVSMDLKLFFEFYEKDGSSFLCPRNSDDIIKFFCKKILNLNDLESKVFRYQFMNQLVIFLIDGLDEICPTYKQFIFPLIKSIEKMSRNTIWISTRPHLKDEAKKRFGFEVFALKLKPFEKDDQKQFFEHILSKKFTGEVLEEKLLKIVNFAKTFQKSSSGSDFNPLLMKIIAENSISEDRIEEENIYKIYDHFTEKILQSCISKGYSVVNNFMPCLKTPKSDNLLKFHFKLALEIALVNTHNEILEICYPSSSDWNPDFDDKLRVGLILSNGFDYQFSHKNFAEFYVAKLIHDNFIFCNDTIRFEHLLSLILEILQENARYEMIRTFIDHSFEDFILSTCPEVGCTKVAYANVVIHLDISFETMLLMIKTSCLNLIKFHFESLKHVHDTSFAAMVNEKIDEIFLSCANSESTHFIKNFFTFIKAEIETDSLEMAFIRRPAMRADIYRAAVENGNPEVFIYFLKNGLPFKDTFLVHHLLEADILQHSLRKRGDFETLLNHYLTQLNIGQLIQILTPQVVHLMLSIKLKHITLRLLLETMKKAYGSNVLKILFWNRQEFMVTNFMAAVRDNNLENIKELWNFISKNCDNVNTKRTILMQENEIGETAFQYAFNSQSIYNFIFVRDLYLRHLLAEEIKEIVLTKIDRINMLLYAFINTYKQKMVLELCDCLESIFKLKRITSSEESDLGSVFSFLHPENKFSLLMYVALTYKKSECETVVNLFRHFLRDSTQIQILLQKSGSGETAFQFALANEDEGTFSCIRKLYDEVLGTQGVKEIALLDVKGENILMYALNIISESGNVKFFTEFCQYLQLLFEDSPPKFLMNQKLFLSTDEDGLTFLKRVAYYHNQEVLEASWQLILMFCDTQTIKLILEKQADDKTVLFYALKSNNPGVFYFVRSVYCNFFFRAIECKVNVYDQDLIANAIYIGFDPEIILILFKFLRSKIIKSVDKQLFDFFRSKKKYGVSIVMYVAFYYDKTVFKALWKVIEKTTDETMRKEILTQRSDFGETVFQHAHKNSFRDTPKFISKLYSEMAIPID